MWFGRTALAFGDGARTWRFGGVEQILRLRSSFCADEIPYLLQHVVNAEILHAGFWWKYDFQLTWGRGMTLIDV